MIDRLSSAQSAKGYAMIGKESGRSADPGTADRKRLVRRVSRFPYKLEKTKAKEISFTIFLLFSLLIPINQRRKIVVKEEWE